MHNNQSMIESSLSDQIDDLLLRFGGWSTLLALIAGLRRRQRLINATDGLPDRIRDDIGLPKQETGRLDILFAAVAAHRLLH